MLPSVPSAGGHADGLGMSLRLGQTLGQPEIYWPRLQLDVGIVLQCSKVFQSSVATWWHNAGCQLASALFFACGWNQQNGEKAIDVLHNLTYVCSKKVTLKPWFPGLPHASAVRRGHIYWSHNYHFSRFRDSFSLAPQFLIPNLAICASLLWNIIIFDR